MLVGKDRIAYVVADLKRIGPTNQTLNIIINSGAIDNCIVITLFEESADTRIKDYEEMGIKVCCLKLSRKSVLFCGATKLKKMLIAENVNVVHSWGTFADIVSHYATKHMNIPHIITLRCFPIEDAPTRMNPIVGYLLAYYVLHIYKNSKYIVACSKSIKEKMESTYKWAHISYIQNGVDVSSFKKLDYESCRKKLGIKDEFVLISLGSMIPRKRIDETIEAFLKCNLSNKRLLILGDGYLLEDLKNKFNYDNVIFLGNKKEVTLYLSAADLFISSSESEGMPNAVLEAIACETPVILSDIPQHKEVLEEIKGCGIMYPLGDRNKLAMLLSQINQKFINEMKTNCKKLFDSDLIMSRMGKNYNNYYMQLGVRK